MASMNDNKGRDSLFEAQAHVYRHVFSFLSPLSLRCAVQLGIPDIIHNHGQPIPLPHLLSALKTPPAKANCIRQLMRLLAHNGFFQIIKMKPNEESQEGNEAYALTPASELLVSSSDHCLSPMVIGHLNPAVTDAYNYLSDWCRADEPTIIETVFGVTLWEYMNRNLEVFEGFREVMASDSKVVSWALRDCKAVFEGLESVVDVGGGTGSVGRAICEAFPELKYTVLDLPQVVENLSGTNNLSFVGGNMFESIPEADAVLLKSVLHNWNDDDCLKILRKCKGAISKRDKGGKLVVIDEVLDQKQDNDEMAQLKLLLDISMTTLVNGKGRNEKEWENLFFKSGFKNYKISPIFGCRSLIEVYP